MKTLILNILGAIAGLLPLFGFKLDLTADQLAEIAGAIATIVAVINQIVHTVQTKKGKR